MKTKLPYIPTFNEEVGNTVSHGVMAVLALLALPFSAVWAFIHGTAAPILASAGVSVFMLCIFMMLLCSTLYHAMHPESKHKAVFHILDHIMIYIAIAGSYTPIALYVIGGWQGVLIVIIQWVMVLFGIFYKSLAKRSIPSISFSKRTDERLYGYTKYVSPLIHLAKRESICGSAGHELYAQRSIPS